MMSPLITRERCRRYVCSPAQRMKNEQNNDSCARTSHA